MAVLLHYPRILTGANQCTVQEPHSEAQQSAEKQLASPDLQVPYDSVNGKHAFGNSMPRPGFRDRVVSDREAPGRSVGGWSSSARINGWDQFAHRPGQPAPYERQQPQQPAAAAVGVPPPKPRPPPPPPKPRVDPKDIPIRLSDDVTVKELASMLGAPAEPSPQDLAISTVLSVDFVYKCTQDNEDDVTCVSRSVEP